MQAHASGTFMDCIQKDTGRCAATLRRTARHRQGTASLHSSQTRVWRAGMKEQGAPCAAASQRLANEPRWGDAKWRPESLPAPPTWRIALSRLRWAEAVGAAPAPAVLGLLQTAIATLLLCSSPGGGPSADPHALDMLQAASNADLL